MVARLIVSNISKSYGYTSVLNNISMSLHDGDRIGLVGANGVGKSTLLKIVSGDITADHGKVQLRGDLGYLPQVISDYESKTLAQMIAGALETLYALERRMRELENQMVSAQGDGLNAVMQEYGDVSERFEQSGGYEVEARVATIFDGLRIDHLPRDRGFATLSGGEKARVGLAMLLLEAADVLLLDEPTNHLDFTTTAWLEAYLAHWRGALCIVSHDREFLNRTVTGMIEIDEHTRTSKYYAGNYDDYLLVKRQERGKWRDEWQQQQEEIKALQHEIKVDARHVAKNYPTQKVGNDKFAKGFFRGRTESAVSRRVQNAEERLRRIQENPTPKPPDDLRFESDFHPHALKTTTPLYVSGLSKAFGERVILNGVSFTLHERSRLVFVGANGAGKSTLLKLLTGETQPDSGEVYINPMVKIGYLDQEQLDLDPSQTVFEAYREGLTEPDQVLKSLLLRSGLFHYEEIERRVGDLSSGQKRKLQIARLMVRGANLLILDEPTNAISFDVLEEFEQALRDFPGAIIAASHDRRFIENFHGDVWELSGGKLIYNPDYAAIPS
jgi:macrolide transport system ATP-binding/permease protein